MKPILLRCLKVALIVIGGLALFLVVLHPVENWRGRRAWKAWKTAQEAKGIRYEVPVPAPLADADNFAADPWIRQACLATGDPAARGLMADHEFAELPNQTGAWQEGKAEDLVPWAAWMKAPSLAEGLASCGRELEQLTLLSRRPSCQFPTAGHPDDIPSLLGFRNAARLLKVRAQANLADNRPEPAREDILTILRVARHAASDKSLIGALLQGALVKIALQPIWEGCQAHRWREADLIALQAELSRIDALRTLSDGWLSERRMQYRIFLTVAETGPRGRGQILVIARSSDGKVPSRPTADLLIGALIPKGWLYQNMVNIDRIWAEGPFVCLDPLARRYDPVLSVSRGEALIAFIEASRWRPYRILASMAVPQVMGQNALAAQRQTALDQAQVACALERHRLARKTYPGTLQDLVPGLLPRIPVDVITGEPLRYLPAGLGYRLYSVGSDRADNGGWIALNPEGRWNPELGDWTWAIDGGK